MSTRLMSVVRIFQRECLLSCRRPSAWLNPLFFFIVVASIFPLATTASESTLRFIGPGVIWISILLALLLSFDHLFQPDFRDGCLESRLLSRTPLSQWVFVKLVAHWVMIGLPMLIVSPLLALLFHQSTSILIVLMYTLLLGLPSLIILGGIGAALTVSLRQGGVVMTLLLLPLCVPVLIFSTSAMFSVALNQPIAAQLALLGAIFALTASLGPTVIAAILRLGLAYGK